LLVSSTAFSPGKLLATEATPRATTAAVELFNGHDLNGWTRYSRNNDPAGAETWSVSDGVIRCSGQPAGYIRTDGRYENYRLIVEWRWASATFNDAQGKPRKRNSGVLLHMQGTDAIWPTSLEAQLMEDNAGDFYVIGGVETAELPAEREKAIAAAGTDEEALKRARAHRRIPKKQPSAEKPIGEWNRYEIVCQGDTVQLTVNGVPQNTATAVTVHEGHICLQSEGAPIEFRGVRLEPLK
jgi:hypothetical protein